MEGAGSTATTISLSIHAAPRNDEKPVDVEDFAQYGVCNFAVEEDLCLPTEILSAITCLPIRVCGSSTTQDLSGAFGPKG